MSYEMLDDLFYSLNDLLKLEADEHMKEMKKAKNGKR